MSYVITQEAQQLITIKQLAKGYEELVGERI